LLAGISPLLIVGSLLLGGAVGYVLGFRLDAKRAWMIGFLVAAGVFCLGLAFFDALRATK
jgi:hypothetical protein